MKVSFVLNYIQKRERGFCLKSVTMNQIGIFENGKPAIVLKTVKRFNIKRTPIIILILKKFKIRNCGPRHVNKMLVIWAGIHF